MGVKRTVTLEIAGTRFRLVADADEAHLESLASMVNQRVAELGGQARAASSAQLLAMAALALADDLKASQDKLRQVDELTRTTIANAIARIDNRVQADASDESGSDPLDAR